MSRSASVLSGEAAEHFISINAHAKRRPLWFFRNVLNVAPRTWQRNLLLAIQERMLKGAKHIQVHCRTCHGAGKSFVAGGIVPWFTGTRENARTLTTAPTWSQVEGVLWPEIASLYNGSIWRELGYGRLLTHELVFGDKWYATGASSDRPENLEGHHGPATLRVVDEAKAVDPAVFVSTEGMLNGPESMDFWISTPSLQSGDFYDRDVKGGPDVIRVVVTVDDLIADERISTVDREAYRVWRDNRAAEWGVDSPEYRSRCMAEYIDNAEGALFPVSWVEAAIRRQPTAAELTDLARAEAIAGMDVAGSVDGDQSAVTVARQTDAVIEVLSIQAWKERDTMISKGRATAIAAKSKATLRVDSIGLGKGVLDQSRADGMRTEEYRASEKARSSERFINRKAEDCWTLRQRFEKGQVSLYALDRATAQLLREQLAGMRYEITAAGKLKVIDPSDSPDLADALLIATAQLRPTIVGRSALSIRPMQRMAMR